MPSFILIHGSWHNGTAWRKVQQILDSRGVVNYAPTLTGFEAVDSPAASNVGLHLHVQDIVKLIQDRALNDVILVGHSYAGLVITGVAEIVPERIAKLIFLDAFIPDNKQSLFDILGKESETGMRASLVDAAGHTLNDGAQAAWLLPPGQPQDYGVTDPQDVAWVKAQMVYTPVLTFEESIALGNPAAHALLRFFIRCTGFPYLAAQEQKAIAAGWKTYQIATGHDVMVTMPDALVDLLMAIAAQ